MLTAATILTQALKSDSLAAVHVDLQQNFLDADTEEAFENAGRISEHFRITGKAENVWIGHNPRGLFGGLFKKHAANTLPPNRALVLEKSGAERLFTKTDSSALSNPAFADYVEGEGHDTWIVDGVDAGVCVPALIVDGLSNIPKLNIVLAHDGTNMVIPPRQYIETLQKHHPDIDIKNRLFTASTDEIIAMPHPLDAVA